MPGLGCCRAADGALCIENPAPGPGSRFVNAGNFDRIGTVPQKEHSIVPPQGVDHRIAKADVEGKADADQIPHSEIAQ